MEGTGLLAGVAAQHLDQGNHGSYFPLRINAIDKATGKRVRELPISKGLNA